MNDKPAPKHVRRYAEELVESAMQISAILDHMYRHESDFPDAPPPPVVLANLIAGSIVSASNLPDSQLKAARKALGKTTDLIEEEIILFDPPGPNGVPADPSLN
jgi:hypothetical protein